jgi:hypothetical protein
MAEIAQRASRIAGLLMARDTASAGSKCLSITIFVACLGSCFLTPVHASVIADSYDDWSLTGTQGENNWVNGYYNLTEDVDGIYQPSDFIPFQSVDWYVTQWQFSTTFPPWGYLGQSRTHPNGTNSSPYEQWTIRRWLSSFDGQVDITWDMSKENLFGTGVTGLLYVNGVSVDSASIGGGDSIGVSRSVTLTISTSDIIDLALSPLGPTGDRSDAADGSFNRLTIAESFAAPEPSVLALIGIGLAGIGARPRKKIAA